MRYLKHLWICLLLAPLGMAQVSNPSITIVAGPPSGSCSSNLPDQQVAITGALYSCQSGTWAEISGGSWGLRLPHHPRLDIDRRQLDYDSGCGARHPKRLVIRRL